MKGTIANTSSSLRTPAFSGGAGALVVVLLLTAGCAASHAAVKAGPPPGPPVATESWRALRLRVSPPLDPSDGLARELSLALETALVQAGLQLIRDPAAPVDARLELASSVQSLGVAVHGIAFLAVEGQAALIDRVATSDGFYRRDRFAEEAAQELLRALLASPRMAAFAAHRDPSLMVMIAARPH